MLTPYVCVCCEKVIIAQDGVASLIGLFNKITVTVSTDAPEIQERCGSQRMVRILFVEQ